MNDNFESDIDLVVKISSIEYSSMRDEKRFFEKMFENSIKENLSLDVCEEPVFGENSKTINISLNFKNETIAECSFNVEID